MGALSCASLCVSDGHDRWDLANADFLSLDCREHSIDGCREDWLVQWAIHDDAAGRHPDSCAQIDRDDLADRTHIVVDRTVLGAEVRDPDTGIFFYPFIPNSSGDYEGAVALAFVGEHV